MQDVHAQLESAGLIVDGALELDHLTRCKTDDDKGTKKSGWYVAHEFVLRNGARVITGRYGNWKRYGDEALKIQFDLPPLSDEEKAEFAKRQAEQRMQAEQERQNRAVDAAQRAERIFSKLPDSGKSDYLTRKKVRAFGVKFSRGSIVVPVRNIDGDLVGLQFIDAAGEKKFLTGTPKRGCMHVIGDIQNGSPFAIAEGYATAASIHMAMEMQLPVVVAFDAGNLMHVAQAQRTKYPNSKVIICADDDAEKLGCGCFDCGYFIPMSAPNYAEFKVCPNCKSKDCHISNTGITKGTSTARCIGAVMSVPDFSVVQRRAA